MSESDIEPHSWEHYFDLLISGKGFTFGTVEGYQGECMCELGRRVRSPPLQIPPGCSLESSSKGQVT